jgi:hypothetical protein
MTVANNLYTNSTFVDESTLTHTKLNVFDANVEAGLELLASAISKFGGDNRVIDDPDVTTECEVTASVVPDMNVSVNTGIAIVSGTIVQNEASAVLTITAPTTNPRYTVVQINNAGALSTVNGAEGAVPVEPSADPDNIKLAAIYLTQNCPHIDDVDGGDGYIIDRRTIFAYHPTTLERKVSFSIPGEVSVTGGDAGDGYYHSIDGGAGFTFGQAITINEAFISSGDKPTGADLIITLHNMTAVTSDTITLSAGALCEIDPSVSLAFAAADVLGIQVTQVGSTIAGSWIEIVLQYELQ